MGLRTFFLRILRVLNGLPVPTTNTSGQSESRTARWISMHHYSETQSDENLARHDDQPELAPGSEWEDPFNGMAVAVPIEEQIDLHTFAPDETEDVLNAYIEAARDHGLRRLRIVHGRGKGVQRAIVRACLGRHHYVQSFSDALPEEGGWGATIVILKT